MKIFIFSTICSLKIVTATNELLSEDMQRIVPRLHHVRLMGEVRGGQVSLIEELIGSAEHELRPSFHQIIAANAYANALRHSDISDEYFFALSAIDVAYRNQNFLINNLDEY